MLQNQKSCRPIFKVLFIIIIAFIVWCIIPETREFPELENPKTITFEWEYQGSKYSITETFYKTVYDYYYENPEKYCWNEEENFETCLKMFLEEAEEDNTISKIASEIKTLGLKDKLSDDELLELTMSFVQSIPYDKDKSELIESWSNTFENYSNVVKSFPRHPYEVLYNNEGICTGKTFLAASLIKKLGYGVALFAYEDHIVPAIKCPVEYSSYNSGYCYAEATEVRFKIGEMPSIDSDTKMPKTRTHINLFEERDIESNETELRNAEIYKIADGNSYQKIIKTRKTIQKIEQTEKELCESEGIVELLKEEVDQLENKARSFEPQVKAADEKNEYEKIYSQYELICEEYESKLNECKKEIDRYNNLVNDFNALLENFYK